MAHSYRTTVRALTHNEVIYLRKKARQLEGFRATKPPTHGLTPDVQSYLDKLAISFVRKDY